MRLFAIFGINSDGLNLVVNLLILTLVVVWLAIVYWTYADARRRMLDPMLIGCATAASLFPFVGTMIYMIVRPPEYLEDIRERELEMQAAEARLHQAGFQLCPHCDAEIERDFLRCPACMRKLKDPCTNCARPLEPAWRVCPYCEAEVVPPEAQAGQRRSKRRRTGTTSEQPAVTEAPPG
ncbi:MAG TPA: zinc ribbon domain-containing protein [Solirubrobacteraceae bacterium]